MTRLRRRLALLAAIWVLPGTASALEPWTVPDVARPCPHLGPGWIAVEGSRTCIRIGGKVIAEYGTSAKPVQHRHGREGTAGFGTRARVKVEARTETDIGDVTLVYQTDIPGRRALGR